MWVGMGLFGWPGAAQSRRREGSRDLPEGRASVVGDLGEASEARRPFQWVKLPEELGPGNTGTDRSLFCPEQMGHRGKFYRDGRKI